MELTVAITGASGAIYAQKTLTHLASSGVVERINLIFSESARTVAMVELGFDLRSADEKKLNDWIRALPARDIAVHAVVIKYRGGGQPEIVAGHATETASGHYDVVNTSNSLPDKLKAIGELLARDFQSARIKYEVTFTSPMPAGTPIALTLLRPNVKFDVTSTRLR